MGLFSFSEDVNRSAMESVQKLMAGAGVVPIPELVRQVHQGNSSGWHEAASKADGIVRAHEQTSDRGMQALQRLESSWTGDGADAAAGRIRTGAKAAQVSSEVYGANARQYTDSAYAFDNLKSQLTPMENQAPERSAWDTLTPWDTDTEDKVNQYNAQLEQNRQAYQSYEQTMKSSQSGMRNDFGDTGALGGGFGDITIAKDGAGRNGTDHSTGIMTFDESGPGSRSNPPGGSAVPPVGGQGSVNGPSTGGGPSSYTPQVPPAAGDDSTSTSSYSPPNVTNPAASYQSPGYNPATGFGPNSGGSSSSSPGSGSFGGTLGGFGPTGGAGGTGGGRFSAPGLGGGSGSGSGGAGSASGRLPGGGAAGGAVGAGKGTGAGPLGAGGPAAAGGTSSGGAAGRGAGMGAMGGAGAGRGKGSDDEEHQRRFVQNDDEAFALTEDGEVLRDPETGNVITPPTIGG